MSEPSPPKSEFDQLIELYAREPSAAHLAAVLQYTQTHCSEETLRHISVCLSMIATQGARIDELRKIIPIMAQNSGLKFGDVGGDVNVQQGDNPVSDQSTNIHSPHHNGESGGIWGAIKTIWNALKKWWGG